MRRFSLGVTLLALPALALALVLAGCSDKGKDTPGGGGSGGGGGGGDGGGDQHTEATKALEPGDGVLTGKITFKGTPDLDALTKELREKMKTKDPKECSMGSERETTEQAYRVGKNGNLGNVFVWVVPAKGTYFKVTDAQLKALPKTVDTHQPHCAFLPHCIFHFSRYRPKPGGKYEKTGQIWVAHNDATVGHNTNYKGEKNSGDNIVLAAGAKPREVNNLVPETSPVLITCNVHPWMNSYMRVVDTPYYAISLSDTSTFDEKDKIAMDDKNFGTYEIKGLPVVKVKVIAWHEACGYLTSGQGDEVDVLPGGKPTTKDFTATPK